MIEGIRIHHFSIYKKFIVLNNRQETLNALFITLYPSATMYYKIVSKMKEYNLENNYRQKY